MDDKSSLRLALKDAHAVFLVTNFWATISKEQEELQGKNVADVAKVKSQSLSFPLTELIIYLGAQCQASDI
jgi:hypothetical protein